MILTAITVILVSSVAFADNDCSVCDNMQFSASGGLEIEYSRYMGEWFKVGTYDGRPTYMCPGIDCQGLDNVMAWINKQGQLPPSPFVNIIFKLAGGKDYSLSKGCLNLVHL